VAHQRDVIVESLPHSREEADVYREAYPCSPCLCFARLSLGMRLGGVKLLFLRSRMDVGA
jgi:hypothetical protein